MSDDQGDAELEAGMADRDPGDDDRAAGDRGVTEVRRLFAGLHEDLLQIRAIAAAIAERDHTDDVRAVRATVEDLGARDVNAPVREELSGLRDMVVSIQASDPVGELRAELEPLRDGLDRMSARLADDSDHRRLLERIDGLGQRLEELAGADRSQEVLDRLDTLSTREQVRGLAADLRAHLADALGGLDGDVLSAEVAHVRDAVDDESRAVTETLLRLQETMLDVASGEVVGALWDELRALRDAVESYEQATAAGGDIDADSVVDQLREELDRLGARLEPDDAAARAAADGVARTSSDVRELSDDLDGAVAEIRAVAAAVDRLAEATAEPADAEPSGPDPAVVSLQDHVRSLTDEVRALLAAAEPDVGSDRAAAADHDDGSTTRALLDAMTDDLAALRTELHDGLVVEPSDDLTHTLEALQAEIDGLRTGLEVLPTMQSSLEALREAIAVLDGGPAEGAEPETAEIRQELEAIRSAVEAVQGQLDEGLVLADDVELPAPAGDAAASAAVVDQIASLRDQLSTELDGLRASILSGDTGTGEPGDREEVFASIDPDTVDLLREEIRAAGGVSDQVVDALREELKALRRRLAVKAQEKVLSDEQLRVIADAVAERLGRD